MASVNTVYQALLSVANKEQTGFVTPSVFNTIAPVAQTEVYIGLFNELTKAKKIRAANVDAKEQRSRINIIDNELARFIEVDQSVTVTASSAPKPDMLHRIILIETSTGNPVDFTYDPAYFKGYKNNRILNASTSGDVVVLVADTLKTYNLASGTLSITYYRFPEGLNVSTGAKVQASPRFGYTETTSGKYTYNSSTSVDFELSDEFIPELVVCMAKMLGVSLRDADLYNFASAQEAQNAAE